MNQQRVRAVLIIALLLPLLLPACAVSSAYFGKTAVDDTRVLRFWNPGEPATLDPHKTAGVPELNIMLNLFESLTSYDPRTLEPQPGVAVRWEAQEQARRWIFHLRQNGRWSDGRPLTAQDFVWSWQRAVTPQTACPYVYLFYYIRNGEAVSRGEMPAEALGVRARDDYTLEVEMENPTSFFINLTSQTVFAALPRAAIERWGAAWTDPDKIVVNGPFRLAQRKPYDQIMLAKNSHYWGSAEVKLEKVVILPMEDLFTGINLYRAGELDVMVSGSIPIPFLKVLRTKRDYVSGAYFTTYFYSFNVKRKPLDDARVRLALNIAVDKAAITDKLVGKGDIPATTLVPPGIFGYPKVDGPAYDPARARALLAEAGFAGGKDFPRLTLYFNSHVGLRQIAEAIQRMWKDNLGIRVELQSEEFRTFVARCERRDFDIASKGWTGDYLDASTFLDMFATNALNNHSGWLNTEYTRLVTEANAEPDLTARQERLARAERILIEEMPFMPIYYYALSYLKKPYVQGWYPNLLDIHPLKHVSISH